MAKQSSFDVSTGCDLQEVDNAVNNARKELTNRYDFKGVEFEIEYKRGQEVITLRGPDEHKLRAVWDVLGTKMVSRGVPIKNLHKSDPEGTGGMQQKQIITLQQGIAQDVAKKIVKFLKDKKLKKVQAAIQKDEVRIMSPSLDSLQEAQALLKAEDWGVELKFGNYR